MPPCKKKAFSTSPHLFSDRHPFSVWQPRSRKDDLRGHFNIFTSPSFRRRLWYSTRKAIFVLAFRFYFCSNWKVSFSSFFSHLGKKIIMKTSHFSYRKNTPPRSTKILLIESVCVFGDLLPIYENCKGWPLSKIKNIRKFFQVSKSEEKVVDPPSGHNLCEAYLTQQDFDIYPIMSPISFRTVALNTSIRTRFKSLTDLELNKLEIIKRAAYVVAGAYVREINPE